MEPLPAFVCVCVFFVYVASSTDSSIHINVIRCENPCCMLILPLIKQILYYMQKLTFFSHVLQYGSGAYTYVCISAGHML